MKAETNVSRRNFLKGGAALAAAGAFGLGLTGCAGNGGGAKGDIKWDQEADVVVMGFGGAGATAAIAASDAGSSVLLLEKAPEEDAGGNTSVCGGGSMYCDEEHADECFEFLRFQMPDVIPNEEIHGFVEEMLTQEKWLEDHGATITKVEGHGNMYATHPLAGGMNKRLTINGNGAGMFAYLKQTVEGCAGVQIMYETPVKKLIFDPETKEVFGVIATTADGTDINVKANKGVVLACGGFENDHYMKTAYYAPNAPIYPCGTPYNTGDGIRMVQEVGAKLRGFSSIEWGVHCCKPASDEIGVSVPMSWADLEVWNGAVMVNDGGNRFVNEAEGTMPGGQIFVMRPLHDKTQIPELAFDMNTLRYTNLPMFMVTDATRLTKGPIFNAASKDAGNHWSNVHKWYTWSDDNQKEVEKGWVVKADTLDELAQKMNIDPAGLKATIEKYNAACAGAADEFGRDTAMSPIETAPFYATELGLGILNTQGGPARDAKHHVLDWEDQPIPRLYSAGEFGSIYVWLYQGGTNITEVYAGRAAGDMAAAEEPWK